MSSRSRSVVSSSTLLMSLILTACGGGGSSTDAPPAVVPTTITISTQPTDQSVTTAGTARFTMAATGDGLSYQWQLSTDGGKTWVNVSGATAATLDLGTVAASQDGYQYRAVISGNGGATATSAAVTLKVAATAVATSIVSQPVGTTVTAGTPANFSVLADGTGTLSYQWQRDGVNIPGATAAGYSLASPTAADSGASFRVVVSNSAGSVTSSNVLLTVAQSVALPSITSQPQSQTGTDGAPMIFSVSADGTGPFSYQWRKNGVNIAGATQSVYATPVLTKADSGAVYSVVVTNGGGSLTSANATLTVNYLAADWLAQPLPASVAQGQTATFVASAFGSQPITYQWQRNGVAIAGATGLTYTTPTTAAADDGVLYSVVATGPANAITSTPVRLTVVAAAVAPSISTTPASVTVSEGQAATFTAAASGTGPLSYQWRRNAVDIAGATSAIYTTAPTTVADNAAKYSVKVTNSAGTVTSADAVLTVQAAVGGLAGRSWASGQLVAKGDNEVIDRDRAIDDSGRLTTVYMQNNGTRWQLFGIRGTPNSAGTPPTWSAPVALDVLGTNAVFASTRYNYYFGVSGSPNGNAVAYWTFDAPCTSTSYRTVAGTCSFVYTARFLASTGTWDAPLNSGSFPGNPSSVQINDRGDIAFVAPGGTPATNYPYYTPGFAVAWRAAGDSAFKSQLLSGPISKYSMVMDSSGNMLVAAALTQNATTDAAAYRGTLAAGFGSAQVLDTRGAAVSSVTPAVGTGGQQIITWVQNNGTRSSVYAATSASASAVFAVQDLGITGWDNIFALDGGQIILVNGTSRYRWTAGTWGTAETVPSWQLSFGCNFARNGDGVCVSSDGLWVSYDAVRNVAVQKQTTASPGSGYLLGFSKYSGTYTGSALVVVSTAGVAYTDRLVQYDVLPTAASPAGDGRNVYNLWGFYLK